MLKNRLEISFISDLYKTKEIVNYSLNFVKKNIPALSADELNELKLILCELLFNAVIHGNHEDSEKNVYLYMEITENTVIAVISDEGTGFDYTDILENADNADNIFNENGRGIKLVTSLVDKFSYNPDGNKIKFHKKVASNG